MGFEVATGVRPAASDTSQRLSPAETKPRLLKEHPRRKQVTVFFADVKGSASEPALLLKRHP